MIYKILQNNKIYKYRSFLSVMKKIKIIQVEEEVWKELMRRKVDGGYKTLSETIEYTLKHK